MSKKSDVPPLSSEHGSGDGNNGQGAVPTSIPCQECEGKGMVRVDRTIGGIDRGNPWQDIIQLTLVCKICNGSGAIEEENNE